MTEAKNVREHFLHCPRCGVAANGPSADRFSCGGCDFLYYFNPSVAAGGFVTLPGPKVLMVERARDPGKGKLGVPGGFVDAGERVEDALEREILEEVGLAVADSTFLCSFPNRYCYREVAYELIDLFFLCRVDSLDGLRRSSTEVSAIHILAPGEILLEQIAFESNRLALQRYLEQLDGRVREGGAK